MFGATPGIFDKQEMAELAAQAFAGETEKDWTVVCKIDDAGHKWHRPCTRLRITITI